MARKKKTIIVGVTREQADDAFASYAKSDAQIQKINAEIDLQCAKIREKYADRLSVLTIERDASFDILQSFATEHQDELFQKKKSLDMSHGTIGFRTGTPKLKTLKGFTWASALQLVKRFLPSYVRQTEEIAKDKLLADRDIELEPLPLHDLSPAEASSSAGVRSMRSVMSECGIEVVQDETFYVEAKKEELS